MLDAERRVMLKHKKFDPEGSERLRWNRSKFYERIEKYVNDNLADEQIVSMHPCPYSFFGSIVVWHKK